MVGWPTDLPNTRYYADIDNDNERFELIGRAARMASNRTVSVYTLMASGSGSLDPLALTIRVVCGVCVVCVSSVQQLHHQAPLLR